ncbi:hypothetical protein AAK899_00300 [Erysipelotrichaceae bacterium 51-3]
MPENLEKHGNLIEERAVFLLRSILPEAQDPLLLYIHMFLLEDLRIGSMLYEYAVSASRSIQTALIQDLFLNLCCFLFVWWKGSPQGRTLKRMILKKRGVPFQ